MLSLLHIPTNRISFARAKIKFVEKYYRGIKERKTRKLTTIISINFLDFVLNFVLNCLQDAIIDLKRNCFLESFPNF